jgi:hypothetical protein
MPFTFLCPMTEWIVNHFVSFLLPTSLLSGILSALVLIYSALDQLMAVQQLAPNFSARGPFKRSRTLLAG